MPAIYGGPPIPMKPYYKRFTFEPPFHESVHTASVRSTTSLHWIEGFVFPDSHRKELASEIEVSLELPNRDKRWWTSSLASICLDAVTEQRIARLERLLDTLAAETICDKALLFQALGYENNTFADPRLISKAEERGMRYLLRVVRGDTYAVRLTVTSSHPLLPSVIHVDVHGDEEED